MMQIILILLWVSLKDLILFKAWPTSEHIIGHLTTEKNLLKAEFSGHAFLGSVMQWSKLWDIF